ncbi:MAG: hypothetical protein ACI92I_000360 [Acidimicrobiales bacterium]|jgi:hypothetical protein
MILPRSIKNRLSYFGLEFKPGVKRRFYLRRMLRRVSKMEGDIVECGVGKMVTFQMFATYLQNNNSSRKLWGFDSFEGFPEPTPEDVSPRNPQKGEWKVIEEDDVAKFLLIQGFDSQWISSQIKTIKGFFKDTLPADDVSQIALLHLDVDLYDSYKTCLEHLFPKVVPGGVVLFDEYKHESDSYKFPGAQKAIDEYFSGTNYEISRDWFSGKYYLIK